MQMIQMILVLGILSFGAAVYLGTAALDEARIMFPLPFQEVVAAKHAMNTFIWNRPISNTTRRKYVLSNACFAVAAGCTALGFYIHDSLLGAIGFGFVAVVGIGVTLTQLIKHRDRL